MNKEDEQKLKNFLINFKPYLIEIDKNVTEFENGILHIELRVYNGFVTDVLAIIKTKRKTFTVPKQLTSTK